MIILIRFIKNLNMVLASFISKNYKWWYLFWYEFKRSNTHWFGFLISNLFRIIELLVAVYVWVLNGAGVGIITYLALGHAFERLSKSPFGSVLGAYINNGSHTKILIRPQNVFLYYFFHDFGFNLFGFNSPPLAAFLSLC